MTPRKTNARLAAVFAGWIAFGLGAGARWWLTWLPVLVTGAAILLFYCWFGLIRLLDWLDRLDERATRSGWDLWE